MTLVGPQASKASKAAAFSMNPSPIATHCHPLEVLLETCNPADGMNDGNIVSGITCEPSMLVDSTSQGCTLFFEANGGTWKACHVLQTLCSSLAIASYKIDTGREPDVHFGSKLRFEVPA